MNEIYLIFEEKYIFVILEFIDKNNHVLINNIKYKFEIISKNKLKINNEKEIYYFYTYDSFLYFNNIFMKNFIYKINLIDNTWYDNAIINFKNNIIIQISNKKKGYFILDNNDLLIKWDNNKKDNFIKYDEITFINNNYNHIKLLNNNINNMTNICKIVVFIHVCYSENGLLIMNNQIEYIIKSKLFDYIDIINICIVGLKENIEINYPKVNIYYFDENPYLYELRTINEIHKFSILNKDTYILYLHTKGVRKAGNDEVIKSWRKMMEYFLIEKGLLCIQGLNYFDVIGNNIINQICDNIENVQVNKNHCYHFSGNFWWSKSSYIKKLDKLDLDNFDKNHSYRYKAENWILSYKNDIKIGFIYQDNTNLHPYHRFIFNNYKNEKSFIKEKILN
jgi:hypothetical protein